MKKTSLLFLTFTILSSCQNSEELLLHVPSPDWEDQVVYFLMTDRFFDGNPNNNELGTGEYDLSKGTHYNGGDLVGIQQQLDYLEELGATAVWITPPVLNQWWNPHKNFTGYHGYWASHFEKVDPHYGNLEDYRRLSDALHRKGMYLIQDVVVNHTGNYFDYEGEYDPSDVTKNYVNYGTPEQSPFDLNDPNNKEHLAAAIYNFTPVISDYNDPTHKLTHQLSKLDDLNTTNPVVIKKLIEAYQYWIREVGVDGYRFDTAIYVDHEFWHRFMHGGLDSLQGIFPFAKDLGKVGFYTLGETWMSSPPNEDGAEIELASYLGTAEKPEMDAVLNFPLQQSMKRVFADGDPTSQMTYRIRSLQRHFPKSRSLVNFIDNHDMARFRAVASEEAYQQAMLFMMTMPGMPVIYQGTEQGEKEVREPLFEKLNTTTDEFLFVKKLIQFRKENPATRRGQANVLADSEHCPGLLLYRMEHQGQSIYAAFNNADNDILTGGIRLNENENINDWEQLISLKGGVLLEINDGAIDQLMLPAKAGIVFTLKEKKKDSPASADISVLYKPNGPIENGQLHLFGQTDLADSIVIFLDGNIENGMPATLQGEKWEVDINLLNTLNGQHFVQAANVSEGSFSLSEKVSFELSLPETKRATKADPIGDDLGPNGSYQYPTDPTFGRELDIKSATVYSTGNNLRLDVEMVHPFSTLWRPFNGFDHLMLMAFIDVPGKEGSTVLPKINHSLAEGNEWDYGFTIGGWSTAAFGAESSTAEDYGKALGKKPSLKVLPESNTIQLFFPATILGNPEAMEGTKIHLFTWDGGGEGDLRPLEMEAKAYIFGGGGPGDPKFMDHMQLNL